MTGRLVHNFRDATYRDLSIEANRRLFITEDLKPASGLAALNPIMYMPMTDPDTWEVNEGTGGDFTANGTVALSGRGPNQDNCVASEFDGVADYLTLPLTGLSNTKHVSMSLTYKFGVNNTKNLFFDTKFGATQSPFVFDGGNHGNGFAMNAQNTATTPILSLTNTSFTVIGKEVTVSISVDLTDTNKRGVIVNGVDITNDITWTTYVNDFIALSNITDWFVGITRSMVENFGGYVGELYFDTAYIDLASDNPFWDSDLNKPVPVRQVIENTGVTPLVALPIRADAAGTNLGSGGDFTVNSGPFVGARGASEYWARSAVVDGTNYLTGNIFCKSLVKWKSLDSGVTWTLTYSNDVTVTDIGNGTDNGVVSYYWGTSENINWALEDNLLRVTDGLGFPVDIDKVIADNPNSVLALDFNDIDDFVLNKVGADFTETGTVTPGADVDPG